MNPHARKLLGAAAGALVFLGVAAVVRIQSVAARRTKDMDARIRTLLGESRGVDPARPNLRGEVPALGDPFGTKLYQRGGGRRLKVWSAGPDGVDDGGSGDWTIQGKDTVLEVER
jgi:hypothetical protein